MQKTSALSLIFLILSTMGCGLFSRVDSDPETVSTTTAVGVPTGSPTTKTIGPKGGSISSADGRISVTIPAGAITAETEFTIQPITNQADVGRGSAYRLGPDGQTFATPLKVSFKIETQEIEGKSPENFTIAYQDSKGVWQVFSDADFDAEAKTITILATHFTDFSLWSFRLSPEKVTVRVGQSQAIGLIGCHRPNRYYNVIRRLAGIEPLNCPTPGLSFAEWSVDIGTIAPGRTAALYTAPAKKPSPNVATVNLKYRLRDSPEAEGTYDVRTAEITIVDNSYKVSGNAGGDTVFSGVICDIERPFTLKTNNPFLGSFSFTPGNSSSGTWGFATKNGVMGGGGGSYSIEGTDTIKTALLMSGNSTGCIPVGCRSGGGDVRLTLTPLDTGECN